MQQLCLKSFPYDHCLTHCSLPHQNPTIGSYVPFGFLNHLRFVHSPFSGWENMNLICVRPPDVPVTVRWYHIPITSLSAPFLLLPPTHHHMDLTTPVFNIRESSGEVHFPPQPFHHCKNDISNPPSCFPHTTNV